jgi:hypothetical protein
MAFAERSPQTAILLHLQIEALNPIIKLSEESLHRQKLSCGHAIAAAAGFQ